MTAGDEGDQKCTEHLDRIQLLESELEDAEYELERVRELEERCEELEGLNEKLEGDSWRIEDLSKLEEAVEGFLVSSPELEQFYLHRMIAAMRRIQEVEDRCGTIALSFPGVTG